MDQATSHQNTVLLNMERLEFTERLWWREQHALDWLEECLYRLEDHSDAWTWTCPDNQANGQLADKSLHKWIGAQELYTPVTLTNTSGISVRFILREEQTAVSVTVGEQWLEAHRDNCFVSPLACCTWRCGLNIPTSSGA